jgi:PBP1b-binding outer membrane lipoprotein LpoB
MMKIVSAMLLAAMFIGCSESAKTEEAPAAVTEEVAPAAEAMPADAAAVEAPAADAAAVEVPAAEAPAAEAAPVK